MHKKQHIEIDYIPDEQSGKYEGHTDVFYHSSAKGKYIPLGSIVEDQKKESERYTVFDWENQQMLTSREWDPVRNYFEIKATLIENDIELPPPEKTEELVTIRKKKAKTQKRTR